MTDEGREWRIDSITQHPFTLSLSQGERMRGCRQGWLPLPEVVRLSAVHPATSSGRTATCLGEVGMAIRYVVCRGVDSRFRGNDGWGGNDGWLAGGNDGWLLGGNDGWLLGGNDGWLVGRNDGGAGMTALAPPPPILNS